MSPMILLMYRWLPAAELTVPAIKPPVSSRGNLRSVDSEHGAADSGLWVDQFPSGAGGLGRGDVSRLERLQGGYRVRFYEG